LLGIVPPQTRLSTQTLRPVVLTGWVRPYLDDNLPGIEPRGALYTKTILQVSNLAATMSFCGGEIA